jgi:hypothetical protein
VDKPFSRRAFIKTTTAGGIGLITSGMAGGIITTSPPPDDLYALSYSLTAAWAKTLLDLQVLDTSRPDDYGGIRCPTEHIVHGRVGDTLYPFLHMASRTKDSRYLDASVLLFRWMERRVSQPDGSWLNEPVKDSWKGTTVFSTIALCEAIRHHGELMDPAFKKALQDRLLKAGDFIYDNVNIDYGNINYPLSASYAMSLLGTLLDIPRFRERGRLLAHQGLNFISSHDGFIYGEGTPYYQTSKHGCLPVDLGYNVEETLPSLTLYGLLNKDEEVLQAVTRSLQTHMEFMLPDGGWDNSWGTRNYKWTYWGSRTSDGCQPGYALLTNRDARFYRVALKNTRLLEQCTHDGLLYGGPHYLSHKVSPSVHHTFCHIKALTTILDQGLPREPPAQSSPRPVSSEGSSPVTIPAHLASAHLPSTPARLLPRESPYGSRFFPDIRTWLISTGAYRATVTGYDREYKHTHNGHATGGALSMLWHEQTGPLLVASMNAYQLLEAGNMQPDDDPLSMPLTPRMELQTEGILYMNISDLDAIITVEQEHDRVIVHTRSRLVDKEQRDPPQGAVHCNASYTFTPKKTTLSFDGSASPYDDKIRIVLPVISKSGEPVTSPDGTSVRVRKEKAVVTIAADQPPLRLPSTGNRLFNFVPGLEAIPLAFLQKKTRIEITVTT